MKSKGILLFIFIIVHQYNVGNGCYVPAIAEGANPCDANESCLNFGAGAFVPDPEDCHTYYYCISETNGTVIPSDNPLTCPTGQYFNPDTLVCEDETTPCYRPCLNVYCDFECDVNLNYTHFVADPQNCSNYFVCVPESGNFPATCTPIHPYFNGIDCGNSFVECCEGCVPYCHNVSIETRDPLDCKSYYICTEVGVPDESFHFMCDAGYYFDYNLGACVVGDTCVSLCSSQFTVPPTTTTQFKTTTR